MMSAKYTCEVHLAEDDQKAIEWLADKVGKHCSEIFEDLVIQYDGRCYSLVMLHKLSDHVREAS